MSWNRNTTNILDKKGNYYIKFAVAFELLGVTKSEYSKLIPRYAEFLKQYKNLSPAEISDKIKTLRPAIHKEGDL